jgi:hypothetical protein
MNSIGIKVSDNAKWWVATGMAAVALVFSGLALLLNFRTAHLQNDESIKIEISRYTGSDLDAMVICSGYPLVAKPYRISIINSGHVPLTIQSVAMDADEPSHLGASHEEVVKFHEKPGEFVQLPLKLEAGDVRSFLTYMPYNIPPAVVSLLCNPFHPLTTRSQMARELIAAKVDLLGKHIEPGAAPASDPVYLFSGDLSDLPTLRVTAKTENGLTKTYSFNDKAGL